MFIKFTLLVLVSFAILQNADGKKSTEKLNNNDAELTPQPNVLTYSTFGFNNVGSYDGFVPSSPDYPNYLTNNNQESSKRLYAPAFPSAIDTTGLGTYYDPQPDVGSFSISSDGYQTEVQPYHAESQNIFTSSSQNENNDQGKNTETKELYSLNTDKNSPIYGTKLSSKNKNKNMNSYNQTDYNIFSSVSSVLNNDASFDKHINSNYPNLQSSHSTDSEKYFMLSSPISSTSLKFPKVVDFTRVKNYYPTSVESNFQESNQKPFILDIQENIPTDTILSPYKSYTKTDEKEKQPLRNKLNYKDETKSEKLNYFPSEDVPDLKIKLKNVRSRNSNKDKLKNKTRILINSNETKKSKNPSNGYDYSTNYSSTSFRFDYGAPKRPYNSSIDEISSASSNLDFVDYQLPETEIFSGFKNKQNVKSPYDIESESIKSNNHDNYKPSEEYINSFKNLYSNPHTTSSHWGNIFKTNEYSYKNHIRKPFYQEDNDDIVHIPKRQQESKFGKYSDTKLNDWSHTNTFDPYKINDGKSQFDWTKDIFNTRFRSEEDLLGLRNHDTSHPSYVPTYKPSNDFGEDEREKYDYKKLVQKWRQNYLKSKYRDSKREYETYASETKPIHVPLPRPYPIEVPRPVIVPVPQPYPVKVPIPKPVAVPVYRELTVPIEKPVPYPVIKTVPFPIVKPVPVPVEKQVRVPVVKPYSVHIPQIRHVFHHTKPHDDRESELEEDEDLPRPDPKRLNYHHMKNSRNRPRVPPRRPLRMTYQDRNRRRVPNRRPSSSYHDERPTRPYSDIRALHRYREDFEEYDSDSDYEINCKRFGKCL